MSGIKKNYLISGIADTPQPRQFCLAVGEHWNNVNNWVLEKLKPLFIFV